MLVIAQSVLSQKSDAVAHASPGVGGGVTEVMQSSKEPLVPLVSTDSQTCSPGVIPSTSDAGLEPVAEAHLLNTPLPQGSVERVTTNAVAGVVPVGVTVMVF